MCLCVEADGLPLTIIHILVRKKRMDVRKFSCSFALFEAVTADKIVQFRGSVSVICVEAGFGPHNSGMSRSVRRCTESSYVWKGS